MATVQTKSTAHHDVRNDPNEPARRDDHHGEGATRGTSRMEAFADGVFAIAFTLPVVEIALPDPEGRDAALGAELLHLWPAYVGYLLASTVIGLYWVHHHFSGAMYRSTGHWFLIATAIFLGAIGFIAFPSRVLAEHFTDPAAQESAARYFVISMTFLAWTWLLKWTVGWKRDQVDSRLETDYIHHLNRRYWLFSALNGLAAVLVFLHWQTGLALCGLLTASLLIPPRTPRYHTEAPIVEGES
jgi:uncharacterized membrane protein